MKLLIIRHGDPDYTIDSLTEKGKREAEYLSEKLVKENISCIYVSPLGRAQATAAPTVKRTGLMPVTLDWLTEFEGKAYHETGSQHCAWHLSSEEFLKYPALYDYDKWYDTPLYQGTRTKELYHWVTSEFDGLLASYGYRHISGPVFEAAENAETDAKLAFFCHLGLGSVLLAHLKHVAVPTVWHTDFLTTSSVTTVFMEKRSETAPLYMARIVGMADVSHLYAHDEPVSSSALFQEM